MNDSLKSSSPIRPERPSRRGRIHRDRPAPDADLLQFLSTGKVSQPASSEPSVRYLPTWHRVADPQQAAPVPDPSVPAPTLPVPVPVRQPLFPTTSAATNGLADAPESIFRILKRRAGTIIVLTTIFWSMVAAYVLLVPPVYESTATLMIDTRGFRAEIEDLPRLSDESSAFGVQKLANQALLLQSSPELAEATAERLVAIADPGATILMDLPTTGQKAEIVRRMREDYITIVPQQSDDDEPDAIRIHSRSTNAGEAALIANTFSREYVSRVERATARHFNEATAYFQTRLDEQALVLGTLDARLEAFVQADGSVLFEEEATQLIRQISAMRSDLDNVRIQISQHEAKLLSFESELNEMAPQLRAERIATGLQEEIDQTNARIAELELEAERFYNRNPELRADPSGSQELVKILDGAASLRLRVETLSDQYVEEIVSVGGVDLRSHNGSISYMAQLRRSLAEERIALSGARAKESALASRLGQYNARRRELPGRTVDLKQIQRERDQAYALYSDLESQLSTVRDAERSRRVFAQLVSPAVPAEQPVRSPLTIVFLGAVLGLLVASGAGYGMDRTDTRIHTDVQLTATGLTTAGFVPAFPRSLIDTFGGTKRKSFGDRKVSTDVPTLFDSSSPVTRSFRRLQLRLDHTRTILVTSAEPEVGKSTVAVNLAAAFAQAGKRTVLIDADVYHPSVIRLLGLGDQAEFDLASCSFTDGPQVDRFSERLPNLFAVALTGPADGSSEYLLSTHFVPFLERLKNAFDVVIMDSPPALVSSDALRLAQLAEHTLLVVRRGKTKGPDLKATANDITQASGIAPSVVMTGFEPDRFHVQSYDGSRA